VGVLVGMVSAVTGVGSGGCRRSCCVYHTCLKRRGWGLGRASWLRKRAYHRRWEWRGRCESERAGCRALAGAVSGQRVVLTFSRPAARDVCFTMCMCSLLLSPTICVRPWAAVAASHR